MAGSANRDLATMLRDHRGSMDRLVASYARSPADRADLAQEIALALHRALPRFRGECSERTFVMRVAHNRALAFVARRGALFDDIADHEDRVVATTGKNPLVALERKQGESRLLAAVRALPVGHRQVLMLVLEGLSHREIADVLGANENAVAVRASRARSALRVLLGTDEDDLQRTNEEKIR